MSTAERDQSPARFPTEETPLLAGTVDEAQSPPQPQTTPLPYAQLAALCLVRLVDPLNFTQIFPYINEFITYLRLTDDPGKIGFYSGLVESSFALAQLMSIYPTARLSDVIGRRPIILAGALGIALSTLLFGCSQSLAGLLLSRSLAGIFSGNAGVLHSALAEMTDPSNRAIAVPIYGMTWPVGSIAGPMIGGAFANAAQKYPSLFGYDFLRQYPYFMPCFVTGSLGLLGFVLGWFSLEETLPTKRKMNMSRCDSPSPERSEAPRLPSTWTLMQIPAVRALSISGFVLSFICTAFDVMFVLFCYSSVEHGGIHFSDSEIGMGLAASGVYAAFMQLCAMPLIIRRFDLAAAYNFSMAVWPFVFAIFPAMQLTARAGYDVATGTYDSQTRALLWVMVLLMMGLAKVATLAYTFSMMLCAVHTPSPAALGSVNGLVQLSMCMSRAVSPAVVSLAFAVSLDKNLLGGHFWVVMMIALSIAGRMFTRGMPRGDKPSSAANIEPDAMAAMVE
ncbi:major facilitator superfamily domain-containing protein [Schizophyllum commune]